MFNEKKKVVWWIICGPGMALTAEAICDRVGLEVLPESKKVVPNEFTDAKADVLYSEFKVRGTEAQMFALDPWCGHLLLWGPTVAACDNLGILNS